MYVRYEHDNDDNTNSNSINYQDNENHTASADDLKREESMKGIDSQN